MEQPLWRTIWRSLKKRKIEPFDPAILLLGIYPKKPKTLIQKDTRTSMFIAALFIIAKPSAHQQMTGLRRCVCVCVCVCIIDYYSAIKKNEILPFAAAWMDLEIIILSEVSHRKTNIT